MKALPLIAPLVLAGCAPLAQVQIDLTEQARRGLAIASQAVDEKSSLVASLRHQQRRNLDDAFDADARGQANLSPDWVIEHRRAYSAALDAMHFSEQQSLLADESTHRSMEATDAALRQLELLQLLQLRLVNLPKEVRR